MRKYDKSILVSGWPQLLRGAYTIVKTQHPNHTLTHTHILTHAHSDTRTLTDAVTYTRTPTHASTRSRCGKRTAHIRVMNRWTIYTVKQG